MIQPSLNAAQPIVLADGTMSEAFRTFMLQVDLVTPIYGVGSPEGVVSGRQWKRYIDTNGASGSIEYVKKFPSIAGDTSQGWVLL